jgi:chloramphenicol O-acetyltransferase type A
MNQYLDLSTWNRRDHFLFFKQFDEPFFGITTTVDVTYAYSVTKENGISFFLYYLYCALRSANETEEFRYRIEEEKVIVYDQVNASPTINRPDGTFGFSYIDYYTDFNQFLSSAESEIKRVQNSTGLVPAVTSENVIHFSSIPWINFTSLSHARNFKFNDSIPKISFGKMISDFNGQSMPVSIHVHHGLVDGLHVSRFLESFQYHLNNAIA